jgi:hypothetical protein
MKGREPTPGRRAQQTCSGCGELSVGVNRCPFCGAAYATDLQRRAQYVYDRRQAAKTHIEPYRQFISPSGHLDFVHPPAHHHRVIQENLEALVTGEIRRLMIFCPPGAAKSTYSSIQAATWFMALHPDRNILACSNTQDLAEAFNRRRRQTIETREWQELSGTQLDPLNKGVARFGTLRGGNCIAAGAGSSITGLRSNFNLADDLIIGHEQANSPTQLDKLWQWWMSDFRSRLIPGSPELVIMTRWSSADIAGRLLDSKEADTWTVVSIPMEADKPDDPLGREIGERLWPEWFEKERVEEFKRNPRDWVSLFQQHPTDERGTWCPAENIHILPKEQVPGKGEMNYVIGVDIALSIQGGDCTVCAVVVIDSNRDVWLVDLYRAQVAPDVSAKKFLEYVKTYSPSRALVDDDNASKVWLRYVFDMGRQLGVAPPLQARPMRGQDKEVRAAALRGYLLSDKVKIKESSWSASVFEELINFPSHAKNDDIVDGLGLVAREMASTSAPSVPKGKKPLDMGTPIVEKDGVPHLNIPLDDLHKGRLNMGNPVRAMYRRW